MNHNGSVGIKDLLAGISEDLKNILKLLGKNNDKAEDILRMIRGRMPHENIILKAYDDLEKAHYRRLETLYRVARTLIERAQAALASYRSAKEEIPYLKRRKIYNLIRDARGDIEGLIAEMDFIDES
jgi:transposase